MVTREAIVPRSQTPEGIEPREVPLDDAGVPPEPFARFDAAARAPGNDPPRAAGAATLLEGVTPVGTHHPGAAARAAGAATRQGRNRIQHLLEPLAVIHIRRGEPDRERDAMGVDHKMALAARAAFVRWIRAEDVAPLFAATVDLCRAARLQSVSPAQLKSRSSSLCRRFQTPRIVQSLNRRQQVDPAPRWISVGSIFHASAVCSTKGMPVKACRLETVTLGPPRFPGFGSGGSRGATFLHRSSETRGFITHGRALHQL
jgi:hypothetical protein